MAPPPSIVTDSSSSSSFSSSTNNLCISKSIITTTTSTTNFSSSTMIQQLQYPKRKRCSSSQMISTAWKSIPTKKQRRIRRRRCDLSDVAFKILKREREIKERCVLCGISLKAINNHENKDGVCFICKEEEEDAAKNKCSSKITTCKKKSKHENEKENNDSSSSSVVNDLDSMNALDLDLFFSADADEEDHEKEVLKLIGGEPSSPTTTTHSDDDGGGGGGGDDTINHGFLTQPPLFDERNEMQEEEKSTKSSSCTTASSFEKVLELRQKDYIDQIHKRKRKQKTDEVENQQASEKFKLGTQDATDSLYEKNKEDGIETLHDQVKKNKKDFILYYKLCHGICHHLSSHQDDDDRIITPDATRVRKRREEALRIVNMGCISTILSCLKHSRQENEQNDKEKRMRIQVQLECCCALSRTFHCLFIPPALSSISTQEVPNAKEMISSSETLIVTTLNAVVQMVNEKVESQKVMDSETTHQEEEIKVYEMLNSIVSIANDSLTWMSKDEDCEDEKSTRQENENEIVNVAFQALKQLMKRDAMLLGHQEQNDDDDDDVTSSIESKERALREEMVIKVMYIMKQTPSSTSQEIQENGCVILWSLLFQKLGGGGFQAESKERAFQYHPFSSSSMSSSSDKNSEKTKILSSTIKTKKLISTIIAVIRQKRCQSMVACQSACKLIRDVALQYGNDHNNNDEIQLFIGEEKGVHAIVEILSKVLSSSQSKKKNEDENKTTSSNTMNDPRVKIAIDACDALYAITLNKDNGAKAVKLGGFAMLVSLMKIFTNNGELQSIAIATLPNLFPTINDNVGKMGKVVIGAMRLYPNDLNVQVQSCRLLLDYVTDSRMSPLLCKSQTKNTLERAAWRFRSECGDSVARLIECIKQLAAKKAKHS